jgi:hypothetical protein
VEWGKGIPEEMEEDHEDKTLIREVMILLQPNRTRRESGKKMSHYRYDAQVKTVKTVKISK